MKTLCYVTQYLLHIQLEGLAEEARDAHHGDLDSIEAAASPQLEGLYFFPDVAEAAVKTAVMKALEQLVAEEVVEGAWDLTAMEWETNGWTKPKEGEEGLPALKLILWDKRDKETVATAVVQERTVS